MDTFHYDTLRDYYQKWYRPDLQGIIVVGDIDVDQIEAKIRKLFSDNPMPVGAPQRTYYTVPDNKEMIVYTQADNEQPTLNFSLYMKHDAEQRQSRATREAFLSSYKSRLAMFILRQRLAKLSHEAQPRVMSANCRVGNFYVTTEKDAFALNIGLMPNNPQVGIDAAIEIVEKARRYGFTAAELEHAKVQHTVNIEHRLDNKNKTRNAEYAKNIVSNFCNNEPCMNIEYEAALEAEFSATVTLDDINKTMAEIVDNKNQVCIVFGPTKYDGKPYTMPTSDQLKTWIESAQQREYTNDNTAQQVDPVFMKKLPKRVRYSQSEQPTMVTPNTSFRTA